MDVYNIIRQLTDHEDDRGEMRRECFNALLPIMDCLKGWDPYPAKSQFNFYPNEDYHYQEGYEVKINVDDDVERVEKIEALNKDIDEYNDWVNEKNKLHAEELLEKAQPSNTEAFDVKHLQLKNPSYKTLERYKPWLCTFKMDITGLTDIIGDIWRYIDDEEIYKLKEEMHIKLFVKRFNATLFDYIRQAVNWEEENHAFGIDSLWYEPNREFVTWFSIRNLRPLVPEVTMSRRNDHDVLPPGKNDKEYIIIEM